MSSIVTLEGKNATNMILYLKGVDARLSDIQNDVFTDVVFADGTQLKDVTFAQLQAIAVSLETKNLTNLVLYLKGVDPKISDIQSDIFTDVVLPDGTQLKDVTFSQLQTLVVSLEGKNITSVTYETKN